MEKSEKFDFINKKLKALSQSDFLQFVEESPLKEKEKTFLIDIRSGFSINELSQKHGLSLSRISQWKREIYDQLYDWEKNYIDVSINLSSNKINIEKLVNDKVLEVLNEKTKQVEEKEALLNSLLEKEERKRIQKKIRNLDKELNSRGTKRAEPTIIIKNESLKKENIEISKKDLKMKYLPLYVQGKISSKEICNILDITAARLSQMKKEYLIRGDKYFTEHGNKHKPPTNKTADEIKNRICSLYKEKYEFKPLKSFVIDLEDIYKIRISISTVKKILEEKDLYRRNSDRFIGISNEQIGTDFLSIIKSMDKTIEKKELSDIEQFGLIELCELAFSKTYLTLNSFSKKLFNKIFRTSYSCINFFIEEKHIDILEKWNYWNKNHEHFSYVYNEHYRLKVISDIRNVYYPMFKIIEEYIISAKKKLA